MPNHPYKLGSVTTSPKGRVTADLLENDIIIARVKRPAKQTRFCPPFEYTFMSDNAKSRFDMWCDTMFINEAIELLYGEHK